MAGSMTRSTYNVQQLIDQAARLLQAHGANVDRSSDHERQQRGAAELLVGLGITPTLPPESALDLDGHAAYNRRIHND